MKSSFKKILTVAAFAALSVSAAQANLIVNGGFESNYQAPGTWNVYSSLTGWTGGAGGIELRNNNAGTAYEGSNFVELDTYYNSLASQVVTTTGEHYTLSFAYAPRAGVGSASNGIEVWWNSMLVGTFTGSGIGASDNVWGIYSIDVEGTAPSSTLEFRAVGTSDGLGGSLDAVSLEIPEPSSLALLGLALGGLGFFSRRKA